MNSILASLVHIKIFKNLRLFFTFCICILLRSYLFAQYPQLQKQGTPAIGQIKGILTDAANGELVEYAAVALLRSRDSSVVQGILTDSSGNFHFQEVPFGRYFIKITCVGYQNYTKDSLVIRPSNEILDLGKLKLIPVAVQTEEVVIESEKANIEIGPEKRVFNVEKNWVSQGGTAQDILQQIPSVTIDNEGRASLRGNGNVTILINGKPTALTGSNRSAFLEQIPANLIEKVEVITNPSARYDADGTAGIINIVLKQNQKPGYFGSINFNAGTNHKYNTGFTFSYGTSKINLSASYSFRYNQMWFNGFSFRKNILRDTLFYFDQNNRGNTIRRTHGANLSLEYRLNPKNSIALNVSLNTNENPRSETIDNRYLNESRIQTGSSPRNSFEDETRLGWDAGINFQKTFRNNEHKLVALANYSGNRSINTFTANQINNRLYNRFDERLSQQNRNNDKFDLSILQIDYLQPLQNGARLEVGYKGIARIVDSDFRAENYDFSIQRWENDANLTNHFIFKEQVHAVYGIYASKIKKIDYQVGLRLEQAFTLSEQLVQQGKYHYNYFSFFPSLHLSYKMNNIHNWQWNYTRRINRPEVGALNPFINYTDPLNQRKGNPFLRPEYINSFELQHIYYSKKLTLTSTLYYRLTTSQIVRYRYLNAEGIAITTFENLNDGHSYGAEFIAINRWTKFWNTTTSFNLFGLELNDATLTGGMIRRGVSFVGKVISNFTIAKNLDFQLSYDITGPRVIPQGKFYEIHALDAAIRYTVLKGKGTVIININDIFDTRRFRIFTQSPSFEQEFIRKRETRILYIGFNYNFGNMKLQQSNKGRRQNRENSSETGGEIQF
ncbi:MAG: TonB-dependent receptor [Bacteroidia bacterium]|nr:TonB-dependent receptor [Bacteroidia bacterium]MDW8158780.1 TonB-dependent receptor [Bacteroidia bacterium]